MAWQAIKPKAGVFSALTRKLEVKGVRVFKVHSSLPEYLKLVRPIYGLILLSEWHERERDDSLVINNPVPNLFFACQVNQNACATDAILSVLMNSTELCSEKKNSPEVKIGPQLTMLKELTKDFSPEQKGQAISNNEFIRAVHNSFATKEEHKTYNFVSYLPMDGVLYELDGQKEGPISHGPCPGRQKDGDWLKMVHPIVEEQMNSYSRNKIKFCLVAVVKGSLVSYLIKLNKLKREQEELEDRYLYQRGGYLSTLTFGREMWRFDYRCAHVKLKLSLASIRLVHWRKANELLKHNYIPFVLNLLKLLSEENLLKPLIERVKKRKSQ